jgi:hypothetical protein
VLRLCTSNNILTFVHPANSHLDAVVSLRMCISLTPPYQPLSSPPGLLLGQRSSVGLGPVPRLPPGLQAPIKAGVETVCPQSPPAHPQPHPPGPGGQPGLWERCFGGQRSHIFISLLNVYRVEDWEIWSHEQTTVKCIWSSKRLNGVAVPLSCHVSLAWQLLTFGFTS